jgi:tRNA(Ile)-lysidine synthase
VGPHPAVAQVRTAVRTDLRDLVGDGRALVLVAVSGGADSLALLAAACFVAPRMGLQVGAVTVDHSLQEGSAERARAVAAAAAALGADPVSIWHLTVTGPGGPEGAARRLRYEALHGAARAARARAVLLAHTRDDQAETVLLGLARGSGPRSLAGMPAVSGLVRRPLIDLPRALVREAAEASAPAVGLDVWDDPHNADAAFARARVRHAALPVLEQQVGPGVAAALARTAALLRDDCDALDDWAERETARLLRNGPDGALDVDAVGLSSLPRAVRTRVLRLAALSAGAPAGDLRHGHVTTLDSLVTTDAAGSVADLPGVQAHRRAGLLRLQSRDTGPADPTDVAG